MFNILLIFLCVQIKLFHCHCHTQLGNYAVEITQMTLESAWIYEIHYFQLKFVSIDRKEIKIIALTYFLATLPILATKIAITLHLGLVALDSH